MESFQDKFNKAIEGLDHKDVADYLRVSRPTVERWSKGITEPVDSWQAVIFRGIEMLRNKK